MSDIQESTNSGNAEQASGAADRVGDVLRKERIAKRIAVETVAKDLKLNVRYIKMLEANDYEHLPADPYIRVYLRTMAKYLLLDPEEILKRFYRERGVPPEKYQKDVSTKISIDVIERDKSYKPWLVVAIVVALLAGVTLFAGKKGWLGNSSPEMMGELRPTTLSADPEPVPDSLIPQDTSLAGRADSVADISDSVTVGVVPLDSAKSKGVKLTIRTETDSVWVQAYADGKSWMSILVPGSAKTLFAQDSLNLHVGNSRAVKYFMNGKAWRKPRNTGGVIYFRLDSNGRYEEWTQAKWQSVFQNRI